MAKVKIKAQHRAQNETEFSYQNRRVAYGEKRLRSAQWAYDHFPAKPTKYFDVEDYRRVKKDFKRARDYLRNARQARTIAYAHEKGYLPLFLS